MIRRLLPGLALHLALCLPASAAEWALDRDASRLGFTATQAGAAFTGRFSGWNAHIRFDPADPAAASLSVDIPLAGLRTDDATRDAALPGAEWFDMARFPTARFQATGFTPLGSDRYVTRGTLRIRGIERTLALPFSLTLRDGMAHATGSVVLSRLAFGIGQGDWAATDIIGDAVTVGFEITARQLP